MKSAFPGGIVSIGCIFGNLPRILRDRLMTSAASIKREPVKYALCALSILLLIGVEIWEYSLPLPVRRWNQHNLEAINAGDPARFSFAVFGNNRNSGPIFQSLLKMMDHDPAIAFAVSLGDAVQTGQKSRYRWLFQQVHDFLGIPLLILMGDHERRGRGEDLYHAVIGPSYFSFNVGKNHFIVLDNSGGGGLDRKQEQWLLRDLEGDPQENAKIVFVNRPPCEPRAGISKELREEESGYLAALLARYPISYIFASHIDGFYEGRCRDIPFVTTGGGGAPIDGNDPNHHFFHFLKVSMENGGVHVEVERLTSTSSSEDMTPLLYAAWLSASAFLRFYGIQVLLLLTATGCIVAICPWKRGKQRVSFPRQRFGQEGDLH